MAGVEVFGLLQLLLRNCLGGKEEKDIIVSLLHRAFETLASSFYI